MSNKENAKTNLKDISFQLRYARQNIEHLESMISANGAISSSELKSYISLAKNNLNCAKTIIDQEE